MNKTIVLLMATILLVACGSDTTEAEKEGRFTEHNEDLSVTTDTETGCKYVILAMTGGNASFAADIEPLMTSDGQQDCGQ